MPLAGLEYRSPKLTDTKIWQGDASNRPVEIDLPVGFRSATVTDFQAKPATGTAPSPANANDNNTGTGSVSTTINEYVVVVFEETLYISQFRMYESSAAQANGNGVYKLQYWDIDNEVWVDWKTNITLGNSEDWGAWDTSPDRVLTNKVKLIITTLDTLFSNFRTTELEVKD